MAFNVIAALDEAADLSIDSVQAIVERAFRELLGGIGLGGIEEAIASGSAEPIFNATEGWDSLAKILAEGFDVEGALAETYLVAAKKTAGESPLKVDILDLEPMEARAVRYLDKRGAQLVKEVDRATRKAIREIVKSTFTGPKEVRAAALEILKLREFGLGRNQLRSLRRYTTDLQKQVDAGEMTKRQLQHLTKVRGEKLRKERARIVAKTEAYNAGNAGRRDLYTEAVKQGALDAEVYVLQWITRAIHVCPRCQAFHGKIAKIVGGMFVSDPVKSGKYAGKILRKARPTVHPDCYCSFRTVRKEDVN